MLWGKLSAIRSTGLHWLFCVPSALQIASDGSGRSQWGWPYNTALGTSQTVSSDLFSQMCLGDYVFLRNGYKMQELGPGFKHLQVWVFSHLAKGFYLDCISALAKYINLQLLGFFAVPVLGPSELSHNRCMEGYQRKSAHHKFWVNRRRYSSHNIHLTSWIHVKKV